MLYLCGMKYKIPNKIEIEGYRFTIIRDKNSRGAKFNIDSGIIGLGTANIDTQPEEVFMMLIHEISEIIHEIGRTRYGDPSVSDNFKFFMDHKEFDRHNSLLSSIIFKYLLNE